MHIKDTDINPIHSSTSKKREKEGKKENVDNTKQKK